MEVLLTGMQMVYPYITQCGAIFQHRFILSKLEPGKKRNPVKSHPSSALWPLKTSPALVNLVLEVAELTLADIQFINVFKHEQTTIFAGWPPKETNRGCGIDFSIGSQAS